MDPETTHTTLSMNPLLHKERTAQNEMLHDENLQRKEKFQKAIKKMLIISTHYLRVVVQADRIYELSVNTQTDRRKINEGNFSSRSGVCRKYSGTNV